MSIMKHLVALGFLVFTLTACTHYAWVKPVGDPASYPADNYACKQQALAAAPQVFQTFMPASQPHPDVVKSDCFMDHHGGQHCKTSVVSRGYEPPPQVVDLNENMREDLYNACMGSKGWVLQAIQDPE